MNNQPITPRVPIIGGPAPAPANMPVSVQQYDRPPDVEIGQFLEAVGGVLSRLGPRRLISVEPQNNGDSYRIWYWGAPLPVHQPQPQEGG